MNPFNGARTGHRNTQLIHLTAGEAAVIKHAMARYRHNDADNRRKDMSGSHHLLKPSGAAAEYAPHWDLGFGIYPKMLWDKIVDAGLAHLLPAELADFRKMLNGKRPWSPELLRVALDRIGFDYDDLRGPPPDDLDLLRREADGLMHLPLEEGDIADRLRTEVRLEIRKLAEELALQKVAILRDPEAGLMGVARARQKLDEVSAARADGVRFVIEGKQNALEARTV